MTIPSSVQHSHAQKIEARVRATNLRASTDDDRDYAFVPTVPEASIPRNIDFGPWFPRVQDQGQIGICTGETMTTIAESIWNTANKYVPGVTERSRRFNYKFSRQYDGITGDGGATPRSMLRSAHNYGLPLESSWPFTTDIDENPTQAVLDEAALSKVGRYEVMVLSPDDWRANLLQIRQAMAEGCRVALAFYCRRWMFYVNGPLGSQGHVGPAMAEGDPMNDLVGGHIEPVRRVDMDMLPNSGGAVVLHGSWGTSIGDQGLWSVPATMLTGVQGSGFLMEVRVVRDFAGISVAPVAPVQPVPLTQAEVDSARQQLVGLGLGSFSNDAPHAFSLSIPGTPPESWYEVIIGLLRSQGKTDAQIGQVVSVPADAVSAFSADTDRAARIAAWSSVF